MQKRGAPTLSDVAQKAGVNRVTASVVLNNATANTRVSEATRQRILAAAAELRYQPNAVALSLRRRHTNIIGFYSGDSYTDARNPFVSQLFAGLQRGCEENQLDFLVHRRSVIASPETIYAELANGKVDGLILYTILGDPLVEMLANSHLPVIAIANAVSTLPSVVVDEAGGARLQVEYLASKGHRHIFYQPGPSDVWSPIVREAGFRAAAAEFGLIVQSGAADDWVGHQFQETTRALFRDSSTKRPTALVGWEDLCAHRLLRVCQEMGLRIPEDLAIMGFDGVESPMEPVWRMTTIRAPWRDVARTAVSLLKAQIEGKEVPKETVLPVELMPGNTT